MNGPDNSRRRGRLVLIATGLAGLLLVVAGGFLLPRGLARFKAWRAERFVNEAYAAWQHGQIREAELSFIAARDLAPRHPRAARLQGRMLLQVRRRAEGRELYRQLLASQSGPERDETAQFYFDALLGSGWLEELVAFAAAEIPRLPPSRQAPWGAAVVEAVRLTRAAVAPGALANLPPAVRTLLQAQLRCNTGDPAGARTELARLRGAEVHGPLTTVAARLAADVGLPDQAWLLLVAAPTNLAGPELAMDELWLLLVRGHASMRLPVPLVSAAFPANLPPDALYRQLGRLLSAPPSAELAAALAVTLEPRTHDLTAEQVGALWVYWELSVPTTQQNPWRHALRDRVRAEVRPLEHDTFTLARYAGVINTVPLTRDSVLSLLAQVRAGDQ